jgi:hypothetical protein
MFKSASYLRLLREKKTRIADIFNSKIYKLINNKYWNQRYFDFQGIFKVPE